MAFKLFKKRSISVRWVLLGAGILTIIGLTVMNVYSLYSLHHRTVDSVQENRENELVEFTYDIRNRFYTAFYGLAKLNTDQLDRSLSENDTFPANFREIIHNGTNDSLFTAIYFTRRQNRPCTPGDSSIMKYNPAKGMFVYTNSFPSLVCDGLNIARTRMNVLVDEYRWNNKLFFDTNRSMTIALINLYDHTVIGYLTFVVDQDYLLNEYLRPQIKKTFGKENSGVLVWLMDWTTSKVLAQSDETAEFDPETADITQRFPDLLNSWDLRMKFTRNPMLAASESSLYQNLAILVAAGILLIGALVFMFITAQRERELANTQAGWLANVTHELKTPLAVMQAAGENLADGRVKSDDRLRSYGRHIYEESIRLRQMIEKLLDIARVDAGQAIVNPNPQQVGELITHYLDEHRKYIENRGFTIDFQRQRPIPPVSLDPGSFNTILGNLVENAMKYSPDSHYLGIRLSANEKFVKVEVIDHGVGIPSHAQKYVFDKFYRVEDTLTARTKGHGLGLSIVKKLVELNNGTIAINSKFGEGTTFILRFPVVHAATEQPVDTPQPENGKKDIKKDAAEQEPSSPLNQDQSTYVG